MKKILLIASLCMFVGFSFAQKKAVKEAKSRMDKTAEARELIKPALTNSETANDPETWKVAGDIEYKVFDKEYDAEITKDFNKGKGWNEAAMYQGIYNMVEYYKKADELGEIPDEKGRVKNKFRKDIIKNFKAAHQFYVNGGGYYSEKGSQANREGNKEEAKKQFSRAADFFEIYCDMPSYPMFSDEKEPLVAQDTTFLIYKYFAAVSAVQSEDTNRSTRLLTKLIESPYLPNRMYSESDPYELLAIEYEKAGDSINYINSLKLGASKFPQNHYFTPNLINVFIKSGKTSEAMEYLDQAVSNDPDSACELLSVKGGLLGSEEKFEESANAYKGALKADSECERALEGLGVIYVIQAQNLKEKASQEADKQKAKELDEKAKGLYLESLPLLEKYVSKLRSRNADVLDLRPGLIKLYNVYYQLSVSGVSKVNDAFEAVEKELEEIQKQMGE